MCFGNKYIPYIYTIYIYIYIIGEREREGEEGGGGQGWGEGEREIEGAKDIATHRNGGGGVREIRTFLSAEIRPAFISST
jgi:hypothetical protein